MSTVYLRYLTNASSLTRPWAWILHCVLPPGHFFSDCRELKNVHLWVECCTYHCHFLPSSPISVEEGQIPRRQIVILYMYKCWTIMMVIYRINIYLCFLCLLNSHTQVSQSYLLAAFPSSRATSLPCTNHSYQSQPKCLSWKNAVPPKVVNTGLKVQYDIQSWGQDACAWLSPLMSQTNV